MASHPGVVQYLPPKFAKLDHLTRNMLSPSARSPKQRAHGSEAHGLVPIARQLALELLGDADPDHTVKHATLELAACYDCLSSARAHKLPVHSRAFCTMWVALEDLHDPETFHIKPKMHLFQELCEMQEATEPMTRPSMHWTYREEEFGGTVAGLGRRMGGPNTAASVGEQVIVKFCALHRLPDFA